MLKRCASNVIPTSVITTIGFTRHNNVILHIRRVIWLAISPPLKRHWDKTFLTTFIDYECFSRTNVTSPVGIPVVIARIALNELISFCIYKLSNTTSSSIIYMSPNPSIDGVKLRRTNSIIPFSNQFINQIIVRFRFR